MSSPPRPSRASPIIPSPDPCVPLLHNNQDPTTTLSIYTSTYSPAPSSTATLSPCLKSTTPLLANSHYPSHQPPSSPRNRNFSPRFSETPEYIPRVYSPSFVRQSTGGNLQVKYLGLASRGSAPASLLAQPATSTVEMPDLITFSTPVDQSPPPPPSDAARFTASSPPPCYSPRSTRIGTSAPECGVLRRPSFKITIPRCPNPSELAAQIGRATGSGPAPRTYSRTPYPDEENVDYLSRALDRVEIKCSRTSSSTGAASPPQSETPGTSSPPSGCSDASRSSFESSSDGHGRSLPVVEVAIQDEPTPVEVKFSDPWKGASKTLGRQRGRQMTRGRGRGGGRMHSAEGSDADSDADESGPEDEEEEEHLLRVQLGSPCQSPHAHRHESTGGFPGMLANLGRRISSQGRPSAIAEQ